MLTKPISYPGGSLHINARTSPGGSVRVAIRRGDGEFDGLPLAQWSYERCNVFSADSIDHTIEWKQQENLSSLKGKAIRLEFSLKQAELFSFWFE